MDHHRSSGARVQRARWPFLVVAILGAAAACVWLLFDVKAAPPLATRAPGPSEHPASEMRHGAPRRQDPPPSEQARPPAPARPSGPAGHASDIASIDRMSQLHITRDQREELWDAEQSALAACMKGRGFDYTPVPFDDSPNIEHEESQVQPWDVETAQAKGYGIASGFEESRRRNREQDEIMSSSQRPRADSLEGYTEALVGPDTPTDGLTAENGWDSVETPAGAQIFWHRDSCYARARRGLFEDDYAALVLGTTLSQLEAEVAAELERDATYHAALERWRVCMNARGYRYERPRAAALTLSDDLHEGRLTIEALQAAEIQIATADATCYNEARLDELTASARTRAEAIVLSRAQGAALALRRAQDRALARAGQWTKP
jgi:hypothetical protein